MTESTAQTLQKEWAESPRWKGVERAYTADSELYPDEHSVEIHIAVKRKG